jgi:ATP-binding cassette subfamily C protein
MRFKEFFSKTLHYQMFSFGFDSADNIISIISQIFVFVIGGTSILLGKLTIGMFTIIASYFSYAMNVLKFFLGLGKSYQEVSVSFNRMKDILDVQEEKNGEIMLDQIDSINLSGLSFSYSPGRVIIDNLSISFEKGHMYGISGENGSGKTTLIELLIGLHQGQYQGRITYNGIDINSLDMSYVRRRAIGYLSQEPELLNKSIEYNIFFDDAPDNAALERYAKLVDMGQFLNSVDGGTGYIPRNGNVSGGQKQKIALLRILIKNAPLLILDEPTSALDQTGQSNLLQYLSDLKRDKIIIIISHNSKILALCDRVFHLNSK